MSSNKLTTSWGAPVGDNQNSMTAGDRGPALIQDVHLLEKLAHFNRERVPERVVHAKGAGAHGYFEVTNDVTKYTKAAFLSEVGKRTPLFIRFSTVAGELGSSDTVRDRSRTVSLEPSSPATVEKRMKSGVRLPTSDRNAAFVYFVTSFVTSK